MKHPEVALFAEFLRQQAVVDKGEPSELFRIATFLDDLAEGKSIKGALGKLRGRPSNEEGTKLFAYLYWSYRCKGWKVSDALHEAFDSVDINARDGQGDIILDSTDRDGFKKSLVVRADRLKVEILNKFEREGTFPVGAIAKVKKSIKRASRRSAYWTRD